MKEIVRRIPEFKAELSHIDAAFAKFFSSYEARGLHMRRPIQLRGRGFMKGLWFPEAEPGFAAKISEQLLGLGFITLPSGPRGDVLSFTPPLIARGREFDLVLTSLLQVLSI